MNETLEYLQTFARFPFTLKKFLQHRLTLDDAKRIVRERMEHRAEYFLRLIETSVYNHPRSPYLALLKLAQCEQGDVRTLVAQKGLEGALRDLRAAGVYVTFEEFKGRQPIVRQGATISVTPRDFDNPIANSDFSLTTGGSTGLANTVYQDLDYIADVAINEWLAIDAHGSTNAAMLHWTHILPGSGIRFVFDVAHLDSRKQIWFSPIGWRDSKRWVRYTLGTAYMVAWMRMFGIPINLPIIVKPDHAHIVARAVRGRLDAGENCLLFANVSQAVRVCAAAEAEGFNLQGAVIHTMSEPLTLAKAERITRVGARILVGYGSVETAALGLGCATPGAVDDVHLCADGFALFAHPYTVPGIDVTVPAFNLTSLRATAPKVMLNFQSDDYGVVETRACGCALGELGFTTHMHTIRSYSKLVGEGVTLIGNEMLKILDEVLPAHFGGTPLDYQLQEAEDVQGLTRVELVISPRINLVDEGAVIETILNALANSSPMSDAARGVWQNARTLRIRRAEPTPTTRGKLLPLHIQRRRDA